MYTQHSFSNSKVFVWQTSVVEVDFKASHFLKFDWWLLKCPVVEFQIDSAAPSMSSFQWSQSCFWSQWRCTWEVDDRSLLPTYVWITMQMTLNCSSFVSDPLLGFKRKPRTRFIFFNQMQVIYTEPNKFYTVMTVQSARKLKLNMRIWTSLERPTQPIHVLFLK